MSFNNGKTVKTTKFIKTKIQGEIKNEKIYAIFAFLLIAGLLKAQDTMYVYKSGAVVSMRGINQIDSLIFHTGTSDTMFIYRYGLISNRKAVSQIDSIIFYSCPDDLA